MFKHENRIYIISRENVLYLVEPEMDYNVRYYYFQIHFINDVSRTFKYESMEKCAEAFEFVQNQLFP